MHFRALRALLLSGAFTVGPALTAAQVQELGIIKGAFYRQDSAAEPLFQEYVVASALSFNIPPAGETVVLQKPNGSVTLSSENGYEFLLEQSFPSVAAMNGDYPNGTYRFVLSGEVQGNFQIALTNAAFPAAAQVLDLESLEGMPAETSYTLRWNPIPGVTPDDFILVGISSPDGSFEDGSLPLPASATAVVMSALPGDAVFTGAIMVARSVRIWAFGNNISGLYAVSSVTEFPLSTIPALRGPEIITQPERYTASPGGQATFQIVADGNPAPSYQWQRNAVGEGTWTDLTDAGLYFGATQSTLEISQVIAPLSSGDQFRCVVTNTVGSLTSLPATLFIQPGYLFRRYAGISQLPGFLDGSGSTARFHLPGGVAIGPGGVLYVADRFNHRVRTVPAFAEIGSLAGSGSAGSADGTGSDAAFNDPVDVCVDAAGNVYVADRGNHTIRQITPAGVVTTLAGLAGQSGSADGTGSAARFNFPSGVAVDSAGIVYVADEGNHTIRRITLGGNVTTIAGAAGQAGAADGAATSARFNQPSDVALNHLGVIYVADAGNATIRRLTANGVVVTVAGRAGMRDSLDGMGANARFENPCSVAVDPAGYVYVVDRGSHQVRRIAPTGEVRSIGGRAYLAGSQSGTGADATFSEPRGIAVNAAATIFVADQANHGIREGTPWVTTTITGQPASGSHLAGSSVALSVAAGSTSSTPATYQWRRDGVVISGATGATYTLPSAQRSHAGEYSVVVSVEGVAVVSDVATLEITTPPASGARLANLSTRALALTGEGVLIPGFVVGGAQGKRLLIRGVGPKLADLGLSPDAVLPDPRMVLKRWNGAAYVDFASNDNWSDNANSTDIVATSAELFAFALDAGSLDAALLVEVPPGQYTVVTDDGNDGSGVGLVELYDADDAGAGSGRLVNISNRGFVGLGAEIMIPGIVISAEGPKTLLIRAVGPGLTDLGVTGVLPDPRMTIYRRSSGGVETAILSNDNWGDDPDAAHAAEVAAAVFAFPLQSGSLDAALVVTLLPGSYTVHASGVGDLTGIGLVEVYAVD